MKKFYIPYTEDELEETAMFISLNNKVTDDFKNKLKRFIEESGLQSDDRKNLVASHFELDIERVSDELQAEWEAQKVYQLIEFVVQNGFGRKEAYTIVVGLVLN